MNSINEMAWEDLTELVRQKSTNFEDKTVRLLELEAGFEEPNWCYKGHAGFVIHGTLYVEFETQKKRFAAGEVFLLPTATAHKARTTSKTTLFLVDC